MFRLDETPKKMTPLLQARGIVKNFPGVRALDRVDFELLPGEVHALVGENGAGKSTLVNILNGAIRPDAGTVLIEGKAVQFHSAHDAREAGIRAIHQELAFVPYLDVATNLSLGDIPVRPGWLSRLVGGIVDREALHRHAEAALATVGRPIEPTMLGEQLRVAQAQLLEIARALSAKFRIILFDEPTSSLGPSERDELFGHITALRQSGIGVLYISHRLEEVLEIADRITVLRDGKVVATHAAAELDIGRIVELMTGAARRAAAVRQGGRGSVVLEVEGLTRAMAVRDVSFTLHAGEILGLTGLVGAGRTELARCLYGADPIDAGRMVLDGRPVTPASIHEALSLRIAYATEDRKGEGVLHFRPVRDNIMLGPLTQKRLLNTVVGRWHWIRRDAVRALVQGLIRRLDVRPPDPDMLAGNMSGGNQQKVVLARLIASQARVLILDEPTRGIDVGTKTEIWRLIKQLADEGVAVLAISSEIAELAGNADRILVMRRGTIAGEVRADVIDDAQVMRLAV